MQGRCDKFFPPPFFPPFPTLKVASKQIDTGNSLLKFLLALHFYFVSPPSLFQTLGFSPFRTQWGQRCSALHACFARSLSNWAFLINKGLVAAECMICPVLQSEPCNRNPYPLQGLVGSQTCSHLQEKGKHVRNFLLRKRLNEL